MADGFRIEWKIEGEQALSRKLMGLANDLKDFRQPLGQSAHYLRQLYSRDVFDTKGGAISESWARLSPATVAAKARSGYGGKGILERTGRMRKAFRHIVSSDQAVIYNTAEYFQYHQSNKPRNRLPRRVMMKLAENQKQQVVKYFQVYIRNSLKK